MQSKPVCLHFEFNSFRDLPSKIDDVIESEDKTDSNGNTWKVQLYPGGCSDAVDQGMIALILLNTGDTDVDAKFSFIVRNNLGYAVRTETDNAFHCFPSHGREGYGYGYSDTSFIKRSRIIDEENEILINKALHIDVSIQVKVQKEELYRPQTPHTHNMLALLESEEDADVTFRIGDEIIRAHLPILRANAPFLTDLFNAKGSKIEDRSSKLAFGRLISRRRTFGCGVSSSDGHENSDCSIVIHNVSAQVLHVVLRYVYGGCAPDEHTMMKLGKELIDTAHRFGMIELKILVENTLIEGCVINSKNVVDYLLFAEATVCPLLKEYATMYFVLHAEDVLNSKNAKKLQEAPELMRELIVAVAKDATNISHHSVSPLRMLTVSELRKELAKLGLSVSGSKEVLVSRLQGSSE